MAEVACHLCVCGFQLCFEILANLLSGLGKCCGGEGKSRRFH